mgnify:CR=1 FL=1
MHAFVGSQTNPNGYLCINYKLSKTVYSSYSSLCAFHNIKNNVLFARFCAIRKISFILLFYYTVHSITCTSSCSRVTSTCIASSPCFFIGVSSASVLRSCIGHKSLFIFLLAKWGRLLNHSRVTNTHILCPN